MAYHDTNCPCGGKKPTDTMLCDECVTEFSHRRELKDYQDGSQPVDHRRHAAEILLALAHGRKRRAAL